MEEKIVQEITEMVYDYFAEECDVEVNEISNSTSIIDDLEGDSLMLLSLLEQVRKKYNINVELKTLGKHLMKKPSEKIGQVVELTVAVVEHGDNILNVEL